MKQWQRIALYGIGGVAALWVGWRAFFRKEVVVEERVDSVPLLIPSGGPGQVAGVSDFPDTISPAAGSYNVLDLLKFEREDAGTIRGQFLEDRAYAESQAAARRERDAVLSAKQEQAAAASLAGAQAAKIREFLRKVWKRINDPRLAAGKTPQRVCIRTGGGIGVGKQCAGSANVFSG